VKRVPTGRRAPSRAPGRKRSGQVAFFLLMALVVMFFVVLANYDLFKVIRVKDVSRTAGDAGALAAARWQGLTLNLVGDLNLARAIAFSLGDAEAADAMADAQARLCFTGPMIGFVAAQQAAKNNGLFVNDRFTAAIRDHADTVRDVYTMPVGPGGGPLFVEPFPDAWNEYADMLAAAAQNGIALGPENARFYSDPAWGSHTLLQMGFYDAIAGRNWCWFLDNAPTLLSDYENFFPCWWPPLPPPQVASPLNSEIYGLGLTKVTTSLDRFATAAQLDGLADERGLPGSVTAAGVTNIAVWYCYGPAAWRPWSAMPPHDDDFPVVGPVRAQYDYSGADAATRSETHARRLTPGPGGAGVSNAIVWTAAAKAFGHLGAADTPHSAGLVLPAFRDVRLIALDASSAPADGGFNLDWREHLSLHLPAYMVDGPAAAVPGCRYCRQLVQWEVTAFRDEGATWLERFSDDCDPPVPIGGGGSTGGTRRGH
jgi:hypothetical protein